MWVMWNLASFYLETVLVLVQDRCVVCARHTIGSENCFGRTRCYHYVMRLRWKLILTLLEIVLILAQDRCTVCVERIVGSAIIFVTPQD